MPKSIAVIGASSNRRKFGNKCVRAYQKLGYHVFPVHPTEAMIEGLPVFPSVLDIPQESLDVASIYLPEAAALNILHDLSRKSIGQIWFNPGADSLTVIAEAQKLGLNAVVGCSIVAVGEMPDE